MKTFIDALRSVSILNFDIQGTISAKDKAADWQVVLMRALMGLLWGAIGGLVAWFVPGDRFVGALLATLAIVGMRAYLCRPQERQGIIDVANALTPKEADGKSSATYSQAIFTGMLLFRPFCIYVIMLHNNWLWLSAAAALSQAFYMDNGREKKSTGSHWICACAITLITGGIGSKLFKSQDGMFIMAIAAAILCWLLPAMLDRFNCKRTAYADLFIGECAALIFGLLGQAL